MIGPSGVYTAGGGGGGSPTKWNSGDTTGGALSGSDLIWTQTDVGADGGARATLGKSSGKHYFEATLTDGSAPNGDTSIGFATGSLTFPQVGNGALGAILYLSGNLWVNGSNVRTSATSGFGAGTTVGVAVDFAIPKMWVTIDGVTWSGGSGTPTLGTGGDAPLAGTLYPVCTGTAAGINSWTANFTSTGLVHGMPAGGFSAWV